MACSKPRKPELTSEKKIQFSSTKKDKKEVKRGRDLRQEVAAFQRHVDKELDKIKNKPRKRPTREVQPQMLRTITSAFAGVTRSTNAVADTFERMSAVNAVEQVTNAAVTVQQQVNCMSSRVDSILDRISTLFGEHGKTVYSKLAFTGLRLANDHSLFGVILVVVEFVWDYIVIGLDPINFVLDHIWPVIKRGLEILHIPLKVSNREIPSVREVESQGDYDFDVPDLSWHSIAPLGAGVASLLACVLYGKHVSASREAMLSMNKFAQYGSNLSKIKGGVKTAYEFVQFTMEQMSEALARYCPYMDLTSNVRRQFIEIGIDVEAFVTSVDEITMRANRLQVLTDINTADEVLRLTRVSSAIGLAILRKKLCPTPNVMRIIELARKKINDFATEFEVDNASLAIRPTPFHISLVGEPGCGKSNVAGFLATDLVNPDWCELGIDATIVPYTRNASDRYWSGYVQQPVVIVDDFAQTRGEAPSQSEFLEMIFMISGIAWRPVMSRNEDKGRLFTSRLVISTTNTKFPTPTEVASAQAIWRRRNVLVEVKTQPGCENMKLSDSRRYLFDVVESCPQNVAQCRVLRAGLTYVELMAYIVPEMNTFAKNDRERVPFGSMLTDEDSEVLREVLKQGNDLYKRRMQQWIRSLEIVQRNDERLLRQLRFDDDQFDPDEFFLRDSPIYMSEFEGYRQFWDKIDLELLEKYEATPWNYNTQLDHYQTWSVAGNVHTRGIHRVRRQRDCDGDWMDFKSEFCVKCGHFMCHTLSVDDARFTHVPLSCVKVTRSNLCTHRKFEIPHHMWFQIDHKELVDGEPSMALSRMWWDESRVPRPLPVPFMALPKWSELTEEDRYAVVLGIDYGIIDRTEAEAKREDNPWEATWRRAYMQKASDGVRARSGLSMAYYKFVWKYWSSKMRYEPPKSVKEVHKQGLVPEDEPLQADDSEQIAADEGFEEDLGAMMQQELAICDETTREKLNRIFEQYYPRLIRFAQVLGICAAVFGMYRLYKMFVPNVWPSAAEKEACRLAVGRPPDEEYWRGQGYTHRHQDGKLYKVAESGGGPSGDQRTMRLRNARIVRESGAGVSGDSRTMRLKQAKIVREGIREVKREDGLGFIDMEVEGEQVVPTGKDHRNIPDDGRRHPHSHLCEECGDYFFHVHKVDYGTASTYVNLCKQCRGDREVKKEGCEDPGSLAVLKDTIVPKNCVELKCNGQVMCGLGIVGKLLLAPWHLFAGLTGEHTLEVRKHKLGSSFHQVRIGYDVHRLGQVGNMSLQADLCLVLLSRTIPSFSDIRAHFVRDAGLHRIQRCVGQFARVRSKLGEPVVMFNSDVLVRQMTEQVFYKLDDGEKVFLRGFCYGTASQPGDCGGILSVLDPNMEGMICGMHVAGDEKVSEGFSAFLTKEWLDAELERVAKLCNFQIEDFVKFPGLKEVRKQGFEAPDPSFINVIPAGNLVVVGQTKQGERFVNKTDIIPSPLHGMISAPVTFPSVIDRKDPRILERREVSPMEKALEKFEEPMIPFAKRHLDIAEQVVYNKLASVKPKGLDYRLLTLHEAINGIPAAGYARLNMLTSPGRPYKLKRPPGSKGKRFLFEEIQEDPLEYKIARTIEGKLLEEKVQKRIELAKAGERMFGYGYSNLKDERRSLKKIQAGGTRSFDCMPLDYNIVCRMYFGAYVCAMNQNCTSLPSSVGIDPTGTAWTTLYRRLKKFGGDVFAGDYKAWDGRLDPETLARLVDVINKLYDDGEENARVRRVLVDEMSHTYLLAGNTLMLKSQGLPSGVVVTADFNSGANFLYLVVAMLEIAELEEIELTADEILDLVEFAFYGDDHVVAPSKKIQKWFNFRTVQAFFARHNIGYTDATKSERDVPELEPLEEVTYLKRKFSPHIENRNRILAPIDEQTIMEEINWIRKSSDDVAATYQNLETVKREAYHHGEMYYNNTVAKINRAIRQLQRMELNTRASTYWKLLTHDYALLDRQWNESFNN